MPMRRLVDYTGISIWIISLIFFGGMMYAEQLGHAKDIKENKELTLIHIEEGEVYKQQIHLIKLEMKALQLQQVFQREWQETFMSTFKELVQETKNTNTSVLTNTLHLKAIKVQVSDLKADK